MGVFERFLKPNTLYYPGCLTSTVLKELEKNYDALLKLSGINYIKIQNIYCCGSPVRNAGYTNDFEKLARKNLEILKKYNVGRIITSCPACYHTLRSAYREVLRNEWNIHVLHTVNVLWDAIENGRLGVRETKNDGIKVCYHDPCHLGRWERIFTEPRKIIKTLGYELVEMERTMLDALCCGGGGGVKANYPELAGEIAKERVLEAVSCGADILVTSCPLCYASLKHASELLENKKVRVVEISQLLLKSLHGGRKE